MPEEEQKKVGAEGAAESREAILKQYVEEARQQLKDEMGRFLSTPPSDKALDVMIEKRRDGELDDFKGKGKDGETIKRILSLFDELIALEDKLKKPELEQPVEEPGAEEPEGESREAILKQMEEIRQELKDEFPNYPDNSFIDIGIDMRKEGEYDWIDKSKSVPEDRKREMKLLDQLIELGQSLRELDAEEPEGEGEEVEDSRRMPSYEEVSKHWGLQEEEDEPEGGGEEAEDSGRIPSYKEVFGRPGDTEDLGGESEEITTKEWLEKPEDEGEPEGEVKSEEVDVDDLLNQIVEESEGVEEPEGGGEIEEDRELVPLAEALEQMEAAEEPRVAEMTTEAEGKSDEVRELGDDDSADDFDEQIKETRQDLETEKAEAKGVSYETKEEGEKVYRALEKAIELLDKYLQKIDKKDPEYERLSNALNVVQEAKHRSLTAGKKALAEGAEPTEGVAVQEGIPVGDLMDFLRENIIRGFEEKLNQEEDKLVEQHRAQKELVKHFNEERTRGLKIKAGPDKVKPHDDWQSAKAKLLDFEKQLDTLKEDTISRVKNTLQAEEKRLMEQYQAQREIVKHFDEERTRGLKIKAGPDKVKPHDDWQSAKAKLMDLEQQLDELSGRGREIRESENILKILEAYQDENGEIFLPEGLEIKEEKKADASVSEPEGEEKEEEPAPTPEPEPGEEKEEIVPETEELEVEGLKPEEEPEPEPGEEKEPEATKPKEPGEKEPEEPGEKKSWDIKFTPEDRQWVEKERDKVLKDLDKFRKDYYQARRERIKWLRRPGYEGKKGGETLEAFRKAYDNKVSEFIRLQKNLKLDGSHFDSEEDRLEAEALINVAERHEEFERVNKEFSSAEKRSTEKLKTWWNRHTGSRLGTSFALMGGAYAIPGMAPALIAARAGLGGAGMTMFVESRIAKWSKTLGEKGVTNDIYKVYHKEMDRASKEVYGKKFKTLRKEFNKAIKKRDKTSVRELGSKLAEARDKVVNNQESAFQQKIASITSEQLKQELQRLNALAERKGVKLADVGSGQMRDVINALHEKNLARMFAGALDIEKDTIEGPTNIYYDGMAELLDEDSRGMHSAEEDAGLKERGKEMWRWLVSLGPGVAAGALIGSKALGFDKPEVAPEVPEAAPEPVPEPEPEPEIASEPEPEALAPEPEPAPEPLAPEPQPEAVAPTGEPTEPVAEAAPDTAAADGDVEPPPPEDVVGIGEASREAALQTAQNADLEGARSVWDVVEAKAAAILDTRVDELGEGKFTHIIDELKDQIAAHPEDYGLKNIDLVTADDLGELATNENLNNLIVDGLVDESGNLSGEAIQHAEALSDTAAANIEAHNDYYEAVVSQTSGVQFDQSAYNLMDRAMELNIPAERAADIMSTGAAEASEQAGRQIMDFYSAHSDLVPAETMTDVVRDYGVSAGEKILTVTSDGVMGDNLASAVRDTAILGAENSEGWLDLADAADKARAVTPEMIEKVLADGQISEDLFGRGKNVWRIVSEGDKLQCRLDARGVFNADLIIDHNEQKITATRKIWSARYTITEGYDGKNPLEVLEKTVSTILQRSRELKDLAKEAVVNVTKK